MVEYYQVNVKLSDSQLNNLKTAAKSQAEVTLKMNIKMENGNNLLHQLLLKTQQKTKLRKAFEKNRSAGPLMKVAVPLAKIILAPLGITAVASAVNAGIKKSNKKTWFWYNNFNNFK